MIMQKTTQEGIEKSRRLVYEREVASPVGD
jgi:hypothetical protein